VTIAKDLDTPWINVINYMVTQATDKEVEEGLSREPIMLGVTAKNLRVNLLLFAILLLTSFCLASIMTSPSSCCSPSQIGQQKEIRNKRA